MCILDVKHKLKMSDRYRGYQAPAPPPPSRDRASYQAPSSRDGASYQAPSSRDRSSYQVKI